MSNSYYTKLSKLLTMANCSMANWSTILMLFKHQNSIMMMFQFHTETQHSIKQVNKLCVFFDWLCCFITYLDNSYYINRIENDDIFDIFRKIETGSLCLRMFQMNTNAKKKKRKKSKKKKKEKKHEEIKFLPLNTTIISSGFQSLLLLHYKFGFFSNYSHCFVCFCIQTVKILKVHRQLLPIKPSPSILKRANWINSVIVLNSARLSLNRLNLASL